MDSSFCGICSELHCTCDKEPSEENNSETVIREMEKKIYLEYRKVELLEITAKKARHEVDLLKLELDSLVTQLEIDSSLSE